MFERPESLETPESLKTLESTDTPEMLMGAGTSRGESPMEEDPTEQTEIMESAKTSESLKTSGKTERPSSTEQQPCSTTMSNSSDKPESLERLEPLESSVLFEIPESKEFKTAPEMDIGACRSESPMEDDFSEQTEMTTSTKTQESQETTASTGTPKAAEYPDTKASSKPQYSPEIPNTPVSLERQAFNESPESTETKVSTEPESTETKVSTESQESTETIESKETSQLPDENGTEKQEESSDIDVSIDKEAPVIAKDYGKDTLENPKESELEPSIPDLNKSELMSCQKSENNPVTGVPGLNPAYIPDETSPDQLNYYHHGAYTQAQVQEQMFRSAQASKQMVYGVFANCISMLEEFETREHKSKNITSLPRSSIDLPDQSKFDDETIQNKLETQLILLQVQLSSCNKNIKEEVKEELKAAVLHWSSQRESLNVELGQTDKYCTKLYELLEQGRTDTPKKSDQSPKLAEKGLKKALGAIMIGLHQTAAVDRKFKENPEEKAAGPNIRKSSGVDYGADRIAKVKSELSGSVDHYRESIK